MYGEDELVPLSALQHYVFCARQCALIHLEQTWVENRLTAEGRLLHDTVDGGKGESRGDLRIARGLPLRSLRLGVAGIADAVEFRRLASAESEAAKGVSLPGIDGSWRPYPVEYKRGRPKSGLCDQVQLCAQAICLEEMLAVEIAEGALFYGKTRHRCQVAFDRHLRDRTAEAARGVHDLLKAGLTPPAQRDRRCDRCSMLTVCLPDAPRVSARGYLDAMIKRQMAIAAREETE